MQIDPAIAAALAAAPSTLPADVADIEVASLRTLYEQSARMARRPRPETLRVTDHEMQANGRRVTVRLYRPAGPKALGCLLFMHGGGWVIGSIESHDGIAADLALAAGVAVASVEYALAPEHRHPAQIEDVEAASAWLTEHATSLGIDARRLTIGGDSAGGHLAALFGVRAALDGRASPYRCQLLFYPVVDSGVETPSYAEHAVGPGLSAGLMRWFIAAFAPPEHHGDPRAFPMRASGLSTLPETYIVTAGHDPLRDEALHFALRLCGDGVSVTLRHAADLVHGFLRLRHLSERAQAEFEAAANWLTQKLGVPVPARAPTDLT